VAVAAAVDIYLAFLLRQARWERVMAESRAPPVAVSEAQEARAMEPVAVDLVALMGQVEKAQEAWQLSNFSTRTAW